MAGEGAGAAVLQVLVQNLIELSKNEISLIRGLEGEAQNLTLNLDTIQQFLNDAETRTDPSEELKSWLKSLENAAVEADNVINKKKVPTKMAVSIKEINKDLNSINERATELGLQKIPADAPTAHDPNFIEGDEVVSEVDADPIFIGRDEIVLEIVETLITSVTTHDDERVFSILPIVGMGGSGKTTLTRNVFHHQNMETQFESRIWVHVSQVFDPINIFKNIIEQIPPPESDQGEKKQGILSKLEEALEDKTYLLVLDDVWNEDVSKWEDFLNSLLKVTTTKGNGIIVTTRNTKVTSMVGTLPHHGLKGLSTADCWSIIKAKTFGKEDVPLDIESVGREIAERCGGLPLAASEVGGVLRCDTSVDNWVSIRDNWLPEGEGEGENNITKILRLSFDNLSSPSLKKCFAYCSIFPKGEEMMKEKLIEMWMAEGFLGSNDDMESVGNRIYNVLLHSSLLQAKRRKYLVERCVMHDLVHDLASSVLGNADGVCPVRYLFHEEGESSPITKEVAQHLYTLIFRADQLSDDTIFSDFESLHVLTLEVRSLEELPVSIRKSKHLRSLDISSTNISGLPDWIGEFRHLQILRVPYRMQKVPSTIKYLINLRHLHFYNYEGMVPAEIGRLTSLQTLLVKFKVQDENGYKIEELGSLNNLKGSLWIECLEKVHDREEAEKANLSKKSKLSDLWLQWSTNDRWSMFGREEVERNDENVLEGLQPHSNLKKLNIWIFNGKRFPEWTLKMAVRNGPQGGWVGLNQLVEISLKYCKECEEIPMLGHLPSLKSLKIEDLKNVKSIKSSFYGIGNETGVVFPALQTLELSGMDSLTDWAEVESGSTSEVKVFPNLQSLEITNCFQLKKVPFNHFSSCLLKSLKIFGCNQLTSDNYFFHNLLSKLTTLTDLVLVGQNGLERLPDELFYNNPALSCMRIEEWPKLRELPDGLQALNSLKELIINKCPDLKNIKCSSGGSFTSLEKLEISECHGLMELPREMIESSSAPVLKTVTLKELSSLKNLLEVVEYCLAKRMSKLSQLEIDVSMEGSR